jgi:hypothetical protein
MRKTCIAEYARQDRPLYSAGVFGKLLFDCGMANEYSYNGRGYVRTGHSDSRMEHWYINEYTGQSQAESICSLAYVAVLLAIMDGDAL